MERDFNWKTLQSLPRLEAAVDADLEARMREMKELVLMDLNCASGNEVDLQVKSHHTRGKLSRAGAEVAKLLYRSSLVPLGHPNAWSFFATNIPTLRSNSEKAYGTSVWHADEVDPDTWMGAECSPLLLYTPRTSKELGTQVLIPSDSPTSETFIPSLVFRGFDPDRLVRGVNDGISAGEFLPYTLKVGRLICFTLPVFTEEPHFLRVLTMQRIGGLLFA